MGNEAIFKLLIHAPRLLELAEYGDCTPLTLEVDPVLHCQHRCCFCSSGDSKLKAVTLETEIILTLLDDLKQRDVRSVVWRGGGEPTLHPDLDLLITKAHALHLAQGMNTNGAQLNRVLETAAQYLTWNRISLDAATAETHERIHGTKDFKRILSNIEDYVVRKTGRLGLNFNIDLGNWHEIEEFVLLGLRLKVDYVALRLAYYDCFGLENKMNAASIGLIQERLNRIKTLDTGAMQVIIGQVANLGTMGAKPAKCCLAPALRGIVTATGDVVACCDLRGREEYSFGNLHEQSFWDIWDSPKRREVFARTQANECLKYCSFAYDTYGRALDFLRDDNKVDVDFM